MEEQVVTRFTLCGVNYAPDFTMEKLTNDTAVLCGVMVDDISRFRDQSSRLLEDDPSQWKEAFTGWCELVETLVKHAAEDNGVNCVFMSDRVNKKERIAQGEQYSYGVGTSVFMKHLMNTCPEQVMQFPISRNYNYDASCNYSMIQPIIWYPFTSVPKDQRVVIPTETDYIGKGDKAWQHVLERSASMFGEEPHEYDESKVKYL